MALAHRCTQFIAFRQTAMRKWQAALAVRQSSHSRKFVNAYLFSFHGLLGFTALFAHTTEHTLYACLSPFACLFSFVYRHGLFGEFLLARSGTGSVVNTITSIVHHIIYKQIRTRTTYHIYALCSFVACIFSVQHSDSNLLLCCSIALTLALSLSYATSVLVPCTGV